MKYTIIILCLFVFQLAYSQEIISIQERMKTRFSQQSDWHSVVIMEDLSIEGDNGMTWRNYSESYMIEIEFEPNGATEFGVKVLIKEKINQETIVGYQRNNEQLYINSINAGKADSANALGMIVAPIKINRGRIKLQVFVDKTSVEVFGNEGEISVMTKVSPEENSTDWQIFSKGRVKITKLMVWELRK